MCYLCVLIYLPNTWTVLNLKTVLSTTVHTVMKMGQNDDIFLRAKARKGIRMIFHLMSMNFDAYKMMFIVVLNKHITKIQIHTWRKNQFYLRIFSNLSSRQNNRNRRSYYNTSLLSVGGHQHIPLPPFSLFNHDCQFLFWKERWTYNYYLKMIVYAYAALLACYALCSLSFPNWRILILPLNLECAEKCFRNCILRIFFFVM